MPSGHKKKTSKQTFAGSPSQQRNIKMGKENHPPENKAEGDQNRKKGKKKHFLDENEGEGDQRSCKSFFYSGLSEQMNGFESKAASSGEAGLDKAKATPILDAKESAHGKEINLMANEEEPMEAFQNDEVDVISPKTKVPPILEANESANGKEGNLMVDASESKEASQNGEANASSPEIEISHPPMGVRRASKWNCCGLLDLFKCFQP